MINFEIHFLIMSSFPPKFNTVLCIIVSVILLNFCEATSSKQDYPNVSCNVVISDSYKHLVTCVKNSTIQENQIQCCIISAVNLSISYEWGNCNSQNAELKDETDIKVIAAPEATNTTCQIKLSLVSSSPQLKRKISFLES